FQAEDGIRDKLVTGVQTCALPILAEFPITVAGEWADAQNITTGPDGNLWFTEREGDRVGRITTSGVISEYQTPTNQSGPTGIVRSEERRVGKESKYRWSAWKYKEQ